MRVFVDTNVVIDVLARREPFFAASKGVLDWCQAHCRQGMTSTLTYASVAYVMRKYAGTEQMIRNVRLLHLFLDTASMTDGTVEYAINFGRRDFEDAMQYESALSAQADVIVTRDPDGFVGSQIRVLSPSEFLREVPS